MEKAALSCSFYEGIPAFCPFALLCLKTEGLFCGQGDKQGF